MKLNINKRRKIDRYAGIKHHTPKWAMGQEEIKWEIKKTSWGKNGNNIAKFIGFNKSSS